MHAVIGQQFLHVFSVASSKTPVNNLTILLLLPGRQVEEKARLPAPVLSAHPGSLKPANLLGLPTRRTARESYSKERP